MPKVIAVGSFSMFHPVSHFQLMTASKERGIVVSQLRGCPRISKLASAGPGSERRGPRTAHSDGQRSRVSALGPRVPEEAEIRWNGEGC